MLEQRTEDLMAFGTLIENPKTGRILIVDDQDENVQLLQCLLKDAGFENITCTTDARTVVSLCREVEPDLIMLDLHMPLVNGFDVMKHIENVLQPQIYLPILVLTGDIALETRRAVLDAGAMDFLNKPFDAVEVALRAKNLITTRLLHLRLQTYARLLAEKLCSTNELLARKVAASKYVTGCASACLR
jgi:DNA-binding response OmpR family regulator